MNDRCIVICMYKLNLHRPTDKTVLAGALRCRPSVLPGQTASRLPTDVITYDAKFTYTSWDYTVYYIQWVTERFIHWACCNLRNQKV